MATEMTRLFSIVVGSLDVQGTREQRLVQKVLDAVPDGWAKVDGQWTQIEFIGNYRGEPTWTAKKDS